MAERVWVPPGSMVKGQIVPASWWNDFIGDDLDILDEQAEANETALAAVEGDVATAEGNRPATPPPAGARGKAAAIPAAGGNALEWRTLREVVTVGPREARGNGGQYRKNWFTDTAVTQKTGEIYELLAEDAALVWAVPVPRRVPAGATVRARVYFFTYAGGAGSITAVLERGSIIGGSEPAWGGAQTIYTGTPGSDMSARYPGAVKDVEFTLPALTEVRLCGLRVRCSAREAAGSPRFGLAELSLLFPVELA